MKFSKIFVPIFMSLAILFGILQPIIDSISLSEKISSKIFRLHILANSDSSEDQNIKLMLKDYILDNTSDILLGKTLDESINNAEENKDKIADIANDYLSSLGYQYRARVSVVKEYFKTRVYDDFTLPAGKYYSLKIEIGNAKGHNWWCIVFPSVCLSACSETMQEYLTEDESKLVSDTYTPKFKIIEIYEGIKEKVCK